MSKVIDFWTEHGTTMGIAFTGVVVGLLAYGHFSGGATIEQSSTWTEQPGLHICDTAPEWAKENSPDLNQALDWWADRGWSFSAIRTGPCQNVCEATSNEGVEIDVSCMNDWVTLDIQGQWWEPTHVGVCVRPHGGDIEWAAVRVPSLLHSVDPTDGMGIPLPIPEVGALVLAHELGHCLSGLDHIKGAPLFPGVRLNPKTGNVMNPAVTHSGWDDEGIPHGEW